MIPLESDPTRARQDGLDGNGRVRHIGTSMAESGREILADSRMPSLELAVSIMHAIALREEAPRNA